MNISKLIYKNLERFTDETGTEPGTVNEPVNEPVSEPVNEPASEPVSEPASEPVSEPASEPVNDDTIQEDNNISQEDETINNCQTMSSMEMNKKTCFKYNSNIFMGILLLALLILLLIIFISSNKHTENLNTSTKYNLTNTPF